MSSRTSTCHRLKMMLTKYNLTTINKPRNPVHMNLHAQCFSCPMCKSSSSIDWISSPKIYFGLDRGIQKYESLKGYMQTYYLTQCLTVETWLADSYWRTFFVFISRLFVWNGWIRNREQIAFWMVAISLQTRWECALWCVCKHIVRRQKHFYCI